MKHLRSLKIVAVLGLPLIALLAFATFLTFVNTGGDIVYANTGAGMRLDGPTKVAVGDKIDVQVLSDPTPSVAIGGFAFAIATSGLNYTGPLDPDDCISLVKPVRADNGNPVGVCAPFPIVTASGTGVSFSVSTALSASPPALDVAADTEDVPLANVQFECKGEGRYAIVLYGNFGPTNNSSVGSGAA